MYGLYDECKKKYGSVNVWCYCTEIFDYLSLSAIIADMIFAFMVDYHLRLILLTK